MSLDLASLLRRSWQSPPSQSVTLKGLIGRPSIPDLPPALLRPVRQRPRRPLHPRPLPGILERLLRLLPLPRHLLPPASSQVAEAVRRQSTTTSPVARSAPRAPTGVSSRSGWPRGRRQAFSPWSGSAVVDRRRRTDPSGRPRRQATRPRRPANQPYKPFPRAFRRLTSARRSSRGRVAPANRDGDGRRGSSAEQETMAGKI